MTRKVLRRRDVVRQVTLPFEPRPWQQKIYENAGRFAVLVVHRRGGKTVAAVMKLIHEALAFTGKNGRFAYIAPFFNQAREVAWMYIKDMARYVPETKIAESNCSVTFPNGAQIRLFGADNPDRMRGLYFDGIVMDELADMKPQTWGEVVRPTLMDRQGWCWMIGTPKGINLLSERYYASVDDPAWYAECLDYTKTGALPDEEIENARSEMSEAQFRQEMMCDFSAGSFNTLLSLDQVEASISRNIDMNALQYHSKILGVDVAREGDDSSAIFLRQGLLCHSPIIRKGVDNMELANIVSKLIKEHDPAGVFIDSTGGYGGGVIDRLRQLGHAVTGVHFSGKSDNTQYYNKRTEMWMKMAEWTVGGGKLPNEPSLKADLTSIQYNHRNAKDQIALESKDQQKKRIGRSPDLGDALALTFAYEVASPRQRLDKFNGLLGGNESFVEFEFDPLRFA